MSRFAIQNKKKKRKKNERNKQTVTRACMYICLVWSTHVEQTYIYIFFLTLSLSIYLYINFRSVLLS